MMCPGAGFHEPGGVWDAGMGWAAAAAAMASGIRATSVDATDMGTPWFSRGWGRCRRGMVQPAGVIPARSLTMVPRMRGVLVAGLALASLFVAGFDRAGARRPDAAPAPAPKPLVVGFSQTGAESGWRTANTKSIKDEAAKRGVTLKFSDAQGDQENQIRALRNFIQQRVDV